MKQASVSSATQGGGKRRVAGIIIHLATAFSSAASAYSRVSPRAQRRRSERATKRSTTSAVALMFTRIVCPHCGHVGATAAPLPRVLICSQCEHGALIKSGTPAKSSTVEREEQAAGLAAWERHAPSETAG